MQKERLHLQSLFLVSPSVNFKKKEERACKPGSVLDAQNERQVTAIRLGGRLLDPSRGPPESRIDCADRTNPGTSWPGRKRPGADGFHFRFDLAPGGVCLAKPVTRPAGELLPHRFTLTARDVKKDASGAVYFLLHFPWSCDRWALPTTVSCGARTFLPPKPLSRLRPAAVQPAPSIYCIFSSRQRKRNALFFRETNFRCLYCEAAKLASPEAQSVFSKFFRFPNRST